MSRPANVFSEDYCIGFKAQQVWGAPHALEFFLLGAGAALYLLSTWPRPLIAGQLIGILAVIAAGLSLLTDLGRPERLWRAFSNLRVSWISRGALAVFLFLAFAFAGVALRQTGLFLVLSKFPLTCELFASLFALIAMLYPGFVLSSYASIPSWNSPMIPLLFFVYSWLTGIAAEWLVLLFYGATRELGFSLIIGLFLLCFTLIGLLTHLGAMARGSLAVKEGFRLLTRGFLSGWFLGVVLGLGLLLPLVLVGSAAMNGQITELSLVMASILVLVGGFFLRYCILKAGVYPPLF